ncbi:hypothetical protein [Acinetobacter terrae]|jgi:hypothetical protein|uniref:Uncharacterized protein n=1 Tax=Acinetobacter terrae TaxID=2731247 RepID=A0A7Y2RE02_9GAMM|nr:hypothetical protein [Acinetobacter terrae]NNH15180.1 hypothetical protein [Acinetobacter terrae]NNH76977.1 hypothetical protein [Acinetobacter terrae]OAL86567.1 hypothetical protein AY608_12330 [Acinetobacter terrae]
MIGHQRDILATLGIDIWVPKVASCQKMPSSSIWRDQAAPEYLTEIVVAKAQSPIVLEPKAEQLKTFDRPKQLPTPTLVVKEVQAEVLPQVVEERPALHIAAFQLQAFGLPHCVIVIDATELSAEQQQLWNNIQQALQAEYYELQWPFPLVNFQDGRGAESYVQGFIDAISADKNIIFLGKFPYFNHSKSIHLAGLQEMLDQPLLKKRLWQFMQKTKQNMDAT